MFRFFVYKKLNRKKLGVHIVGFTVNGRNQLVYLTAISPKYIMQVT